MKTQYFLIGLILIFLYSCSMNSNTLDDIEVLQSAGFFQNYGDSKPEEILKKINQQFEGKSYHSIYSLDRHALARLDSSKYLDLYPEITVCKKCQFYSKLVKRFSNISNDSFIPMDIKEEWETMSGPIALRYRIDDLEVRLNPTLNKDWLDFAIVNHLRNELSNRGEDLKVLNQSDGAMLRINEDEMKILNEKFGWTFE